MAREAKTIGLLRKERLALAAREGSHAILLGLFLALALLTATVASSVLLVLGLAGSFTALFGGTVWAGRLTVGVLVIAGGAGAVLWLRHRMRRAFTARLEERFGRPEAASPPEGGS